MTIVRFEVTDQQRATDCAIPCGSATCLEVKGFDCGDPMLEFIGCFCGTCCTGAANNALSEAGLQSALATNDLLGERRVVISPKDVPDEATYVMYKADAYIGGHKEEAYMGGYQDSYDEAVALKARIESPSFDISTPLGFPAVVQNVHIVREERGGPSPPRSSRTMCTFCTCLLYTSPSPRD